MGKRTVEKTIMELLYISERARTAPLISPTASSIAAIIPLSDRDIDLAQPARDARAQRELWCVILQHWRLRAAGSSGKRLRYLAGHWLGAWLS